MIQILIVIVIMILRIMTRVTVIQKQMIVNVKHQKMFLKNGFKHREKNYLKKYILDLIRESGYNYRVME